MGTVELGAHRTLTIHSHIITYGHASSQELTEQICAEIETMWNEPAGSILLDGQDYRLRFSITGAWEPEVEQITILTNDDPRNNYFRIETIANGNISFVDGLGCNTGYFQKDNLYPGSTTAAHEYGHTLGLAHPADLDFRGKGVPGIMYPRGTLVDPPFQYDPAVPAGQTGGTMHPRFRKVRQEDLDLLQVHKLDFRNQKAILGDFSSIWHPDHGSLKQ